jgi:dTMP kinase
VKRLIERGIDTCHLRQDGKFASSVTEAVRTLARDSRNLALVPEAELLLYAAREVQLTEEVLRPALGAGKLVVADRYLYTAEVLGRYGRGLDGEWVTSLLKLVGRNLLPDLVVLVDVEPAVARARRKASKLNEPTNKPPSRKGLAGAGLAQRLRSGYLKLAAAEPERFAIVDNDAELGTTVERIAALIQDSLARGVGPALVDFRGQSAPHGAGERAPTGGGAGSLDDALARFLEKIEARAAREPSVSAFLLTGFYGQRVDALRERLAEKAPRVVLHALTGLSDQRSFELRRRLVSQYPGEVAASLTGIGNEVTGARAFRRELSERAGAEVAESLKKLGDDESFELREALYERHPDAVIDSLEYLDDARAWRLRERFLSTRAPQLAENLELASVLMRGLRGLGDARAWQLRDACWAVAPVAVLKSLANLDDARSWEMREETLGRAPRPVLESLGQLRTPRAWALRNTAARESKEAVDGISGADEPEAWALRELCAELWPSTVVKSVGVLRDSARGRALLERQLSLHGHELGVLRNAAMLALNLTSQAAQFEE